MLEDMSDTFKKIYALDLALLLVDSDETDITEAQVRQWRDDELYEWLEVGWEYEWKGGQWRPIVRVSH